MPNHWPGLIARYWRYYRRAKTRYDIHSPFVFRLVEEVLEDDREFYIFEEIEDLRLDLKEWKEEITVTDHGAGSLVDGVPVRTIASIAKHSAVSARVGQQLFKLVNLLQPKTILELGTSLGLSFLYQASAARQAKAVTVEGCPQLAELAAHNIEQFDLPRAALLQGTFESQLPKALKLLQQLDYLYIDGDHREGATLRYFDTCLPYAHEGSTFVIADIHWSAEMEAAWDALRQHPRVTLSVDCYHYGLLFFRSLPTPGQHYTLIRAAAKPWRMGFFPSTNGQLS